MARYIDAYEAIEEIDEWLETVGIATLSKGTSYYAELIGCIEDVPTADVQEVKHGKWTSKRTMCHDGEIYCSLCHYQPIIKNKYCPHCGARMDGDEK